MLKVTCKEQAVWWPQLSEWLIYMEIRNTIHWNIKIVINLLMKICAQSRRILTLITFQKPKARHGEPIHGITIQKMGRSLVVRVTTRTIHIFATRRDWRSYPGVMHRNSEERTMLGNFDDEIFCGQNKVGSITKMDYLLATRTTVSLTSLLHLRCLRMPLWVHVKATHYHCN